MKRDMRVYDHYWKWQVDVFHAFTPILKKCPSWRCRCDRNPTTICFAHLLLTFPQLGDKDGLLLSSMVISGRAKGRHVVDWRGAYDPSVGIRALEAWGVPKADIVLRGSKGGEVFVNLRKEDAGAVVAILGRYASNPLCPNHIGVGGVQYGGSRKQLVGGGFLKTTMPTFDGIVTYSINLYCVADTPEFPVKCEITFEVADDNVLDREQTRAVRKAMGRFLMAICRAADVEPVEKHISGKRKQRGRLFDVGVEGRGDAIPDDLVRSAAVLADSCCKSESCYPWIPRDIRFASLCVGLGRPLNPYAVSRILNDKQIGAFERHPKSYAYRCAQSLLTASGATGGCGNGGNGVQIVSAASGMGSCGSGDHDVDDVAQPEVASEEAVVPAPTMKLAPVIALSPADPVKETPVVVNAPDDDFGGLDKLPPIVFERTPDRIVVGAGLYDATPEQMAEDAARFRRELEEKRQKMPRGALLSLSTAAAHAKVEKSQLLTAIAGRQLKATKTTRVGDEKWRVFKKDVDAWLRAQADVHVA